MTIPIKTDILFTEVPLKIKPEGAVRRTTFKVLPFNIFYASHKLRSDYRNDYIQNPIDFEDELHIDKETFKVFLELLYNKQEFTLTQEKLIKIVECAKYLGIAILFDTLSEACNLCGLTDLAKGLEDLKELYNFDPGQINDNDNVEKILPNLPKHLRDQAILNLNESSLENLDFDRFIGEYPILQAIKDMKDKIDELESNAAKFNASPALFAESDSDQEEAPSSEPIKGHVTSLSSHVSQIQSDNDYNEESENEIHNSSSYHETVSDFQPQTVETECYHEEKDIDMDPDLDKFIRRGFQGEFEKIIKADPEQINSRNSQQKYSPLHIAIYNDRLSIMLHILKLKIPVDVNIQDKNGKTPIFAAIERKNEEMVDALIKDKRVDLRAQMNDGKTVLFTIVDKEDLTSLIRIKNHRKNLDELVQITDNAGNTPFHYAVQKGKMRALQELFRLCPNFDVNTPNATGLTMLHIAAMTGRIDFVEYLLSINEIDVNAQDKQKKSPAFVAGDNLRHDEFIAIINDHRFDPTLKANNEMTLFLYLVSNKKDFVFIKELLERYPDCITDKDALQRTALHIAVCAKNEEMVSNLLELDDINKILIETDNVDRTPLHLAVIGNDKEIVQKLLTFNDVNSNLDLQDKQRKTVFDLAKPQIQSLLRKYMND